MQKGYGNLRLWLWSLLPVIYVALQIMMVQRMDYLLVSNYPAFGTEFQALCYVPSDPICDGIFAASNAIILMLPWSVVALPCLIVFHRSRRELCQLGVTIHLIVFLGGWCANLAILQTPLGKWWGH